MALQGLRGSVSNSKNSGSGSPILQSWFARRWASALMRGTEVAGAALLACGARVNLDVEQAAGWEQAQGWEQANLLASSLTTET